MKKDTFPKKKLFINSFKDDDHTDSKFKSTKGKKKKNRSQITNLVQSGLDLEDIEELLYD
jgi:hypothetical protein